MSPVLSLTERSARSAQTGAACGCREHTDAIAVTLEAAGAPERHGLREQLPLAPRGCAGASDAASSSISTGTASWRTIGPPSASPRSRSCTVHPVTRTPRASARSIASMPPRERRKQRRVHVEDRVRVGVEELVAEDPVVPGADDQTNAGCFEALVDLAVPGARVTAEVRLRQRHRRHAPAESDVERVRAAPVRDHERHLERETPGPGTPGGAHRGWSRLRTPEPRPGVRPLTEG